MAEAEVAAARAAREQIESELQAVVERRGAAERALAERAERREQLSASAYDARSARERVEMRGELASTTAATLSQRIARGEQELQSLHSALERGRDASGLHAGVRGARRSSWRQS